MPYAPGAGRTVDFLYPGRPARAGLLVAAWESLAEVAALTMDAAPKIEMINVERTRQMQKMGIAVLPTDPAT